MEFDGPKTVGKFFKKTSKLAKKISVLEYSFEELRNAAVVGFDNVSHSIIHSRFHDPEELSAGVTASVALNSSLIEEQNQSPIIMPLDFTRDWQVEKANRKRRMMGIDDEDELDFTNSFEQQMPNPAPHEKVFEPATDAEKIMAPILSEILAEEFSPLIQPIKATLERHQENSHEVLQQMRTDFLNSNDLQKDLEKIREDARSEGYNKGFAEGELEGKSVGEKHSVKEITDLYNKNLESMMTKSVDLIKNLGGLKQQILNNIQKNFYEVNQALAESLIDREFSVNPETFTHVLKKALSESIQNDEFSIRVHPETLNSLKNLAIPELEKHFVSDPEIAEHDFKLESKLLVVDVSIKKLIKSLLDQADLTLFDELKKVG